jgi:hypothetical protein
MFSGTMPNRFHAFESAVANLVPARVVLPEVLVDVGLGRVQRKVGRCKSQEHEPWFTRMFLLVLLEKLDGSIGHLRGRVVVGASLNRGQSHVVQVMGSR